MVSRSLLPTMPTSNSHAFLSVLLFEDPFLSRYSSVSLTEVIKSATPILVLVLIICFNLEDHRITKFMLHQSLVGFLGSGTCTKTQHGMENSCNGSVLLVYYRSISLDSSTVSFGLLLEYPSPRSQNLLLVQCTLLSCSRAITLV